MPLLQDIIHKIEVAAGPRYFRYALAFLATAALLLLYNVRVARNFGTQEAMDSAQLARNIATGKGYTTSFVRPFSIHLVSEHTADQPGAAGGSVPDPARIRQAHPDLANPPVYPVVLAGLMKVLPFEFDVARSGAFWSSKGRFWRHQPDFLIIWFNQALFLAVISLTFLWARRLFDNTVAATSAVLLLGADVLWKFSGSGLSTMLLLLVFIGVAWSLTILQSEVLEPKRGVAGLFTVAALAGLLIGLGGLTRYSFAAVIIPAALLVGIFGGPRRVGLMFVMIAAFAAVMVPWILRNHAVSGTWFGTAGFDLFRGASLFEEHRLDRSLNPELPFSLRMIWMKLLVNSRLILQNEFFTFGGGWIVALFLVGLMVGFRNPLIRQLRYFTVGCLAVLFVAQALGRTQLSEDVPGINSENLLVLVLPFATVFGVSFFYLLLDQVQFPARQLRTAALVVFVVLCWSPLLFALLPPRSMPVNYPPYYPPAIQQTAKLFRGNELLMSDVPWAVAWYGDRQCVWLTLSATSNPDDPSDRENFFAVNDLLKPIYGVYLTTRTMDARLASEIVRGGSSSWGGLVVQTLLNKDAKGNPLVPRAFPLREVGPGYLPEQMLFTDWARWNRPETVDEAR